MKVKPHAAAGKRARLTPHWLHPITNDTLGVTLGCRQSRLTHHRIAFRRGTSLNAPRIAEQDDDAVGLRRSCVKMERGKEPTIMYRNLSG